MLPARVRERLATSAQRLVLTLDGGHAALVLENGGAPQALGGVAIDGDDPMAALRTRRQRRGLASALADGTLAVGLRLSAHKALRTVIDLPLAAESNLDEVISFELDRHTPFKADQVYFAARVVRRDAAAQRVEAEITVVPRPVAEDALRLAQRLGLQVDRLDAARDAEPGPASGNLLPQSRLAAARRKGSRLIYGLAGTAAVLALVAIYLPLARLHREEAATAGQFATIRSAVTLQRQIEQLRAERQFVLDRKRAAIPVSRLLLEVTHLLPDDTSLTTLQIQGDEIQLGGTARSAAALIGLLEQSHRFKDTTFRTPVTQDPVTGRETFYIVAKIVAEPRP